MDDIKNPIALTVSWDLASLGAKLEQAVKVKRHESLKRYGSHRTPATEVLESFLVGVSAVLTGALLC